MPKDPLNAPKRRRMIFPEFSLLVVFVVFAVGSGSASIASAAQADKSHVPKFVVKAQTDTTGIGLILTSPAGYPLYRYPTDSTNTTTVPATLTAAWPPLLLPAGYNLTAARGLHFLGSFVRSDGKTQITWHGQPLYTFIKDTVPLVTTGQGKGGGFFVVQPVLRKK